MKTRKQILSILMAFCLTMAMLPVMSGVIVNAKTVEELDYAVDSGNFQIGASVVNSSLFENDDGTLQRFKYCDSELLIEQWSLEGKMLSSGKLVMELPIFGGFYHGNDANYVVFGQENPEEDNNREVLRIVKYSHDWKQLKACSIYGANTYIPFKEGSLRMTETDGKLYIHTCHTMYKKSDGFNHQANMTFVINESDMSVIDNYYGIMNISWGYVSSSIDQFIQTDDEYIYRVDHGDTFPRAVAITRCKVNDKITNVIYVNALQIQEDLNTKDTGVSIGGFELSSENCVIAGNSMIRVMLILMILMANAMSF